MQCKPLKTFGWVDIDLALVLYDILLLYYYKDCNNEHVLL